MNLYDVVISYEDPMGFNFPEAVHDTVQARTFEDAFDRVRLLVSGRDAEIVSISLRDG